MRGMEENPSHSLQKEVTLLLPLKAEDRHVYTLREGKIISYLELPGGKRANRRSKAASQRRQQVLGFTRAAAVLSKLSRPLPTSLWALSHPEPEEASGQEQLASDSKLGRIQDGKEGRAACTAEAIFTQTCANRGVSWSGQFFPSPVPGHKVSYQVGSTHWVGSQRGGVGRGRADVRTARRCPRDSQP